MKKVCMLIVAVSLSIFTVGCAQQKKVIELNPDKNGTGIISTNRGTIIDGTTGRGTGNQTTGWTSIGSGGYANVDPYGNGQDNYGADYNNHTNDDYGRNYNQNNHYNSNGSSNGMKTIYFAVDEYMISSSNIAKIIQNAKILKRNNRHVRVEGHCDASGTDEYNYALGLRRAKSAKDALVNRGVKASNITMVSMGESAPECSTGFSSGCFAKNRRVEFK